MRAAAGAAGRVWRHDDVGVVHPTCVRIHIRGFVREVHRNVEVKQTRVGRGGGESGGGIGANATEHKLFGGSRRSSEETMRACCDPITAKTLSDRLSLHLLRLTVGTVGGGLR